MESGTTAPTATINNTLDQSVTRVINNLMEGKCRAQQLKVSKMALIIELAKSRYAPAIAIEPLRASQIDKLSSMLKDKFLTNETGIAKCYLNLLIDEIVVTDSTANVKGSYAELASTANAKEIKMTP